MKIRETINNNASKYAATVYEHNKQIVVIRQDTYNHYDNSTDKEYKFNSINDYKLWVKNQDWIFRTTKLNNFMKVKEK